MFSADDVIPTMNLGLNTSILFQNVSLEHATRYFFTVTAVNEVGLYTTISSDGFIVDINKPSTGVVFNSAYYNDINFQPANSVFTASWHGFQDHCSGIKNYYIAIVDESQSNTLEFIPVGLQTTFTFAKMSLIDGRSYRAAVKAIDAAGHESDVVFSARVTIDSSPPSSYQCLRSTQIKIHALTDNRRHLTFDTFLINTQKNTLYKIEGVIAKSNVIYQS